MEISEEQLRQLKALFDYFDKDQSGSLDMEVNMFSFKKVIGTINFHVDGRKTLKLIKA